MASLEGWGSTIELHPHIEKKFYRERNNELITDFLPVTSPNITLIFPPSDHTGRVLPTSGLS